MISFLIKHKKIILIITLAFFLGSIVYLGADAYRRGNFSNTVAQVGSSDITYRELYRVSEDRARVLRIDASKAEAETRPWSQRRLDHGRGQRSA